MKINTLSLLAVWTLVAMEGEDNNPPVPPPVPPAPPPPKSDPAKKYSDTDMAAMRRKYEAQISTEAEKYRGVSEDATRTKEERDAALKRAEELEGEYKSKAEIARDNAKREAEALKNEAKTWKEKHDKVAKDHDDLLIDHELTAQEALAKPKKPGQLKKMVRNETVLVPEIGEDGKETGKRVVRVKHTEEKDGKRSELLLPVGEVFKRLKDTDSNLFEGTGSGGLGGGNGEGKSGSDSPPKDTEAYMTWRANQKKKS